MKKFRTKWKPVARHVAGILLRLSCPELSGIFQGAVQINGRACQSTSIFGRDTAEGATPATAQAKRTFDTGKSGERRQCRPPKGHATKVVISQVQRTDGRSTNSCCAFFIAAKANRNASLYRRDLCRCSADEQLLETLNLEGNYDSSKANSS